MRMSEHPGAKRPTDHLPPAAEREPGDDRTTDRHYPGDDGAHPDGRHAVSEATAATHEGPDRDGLPKLPPGAR